MDSDKRSAQIERLEVVETGRRRRRSEDEKLKIGLESMQTPRSVSSTARRARYRLGSEVIVVLRLRSRWPASRGHVQPDRHGQDERRRSTSLTRRRSGPHRRASRAKARRTAALELASAQGAGQSGGLIMAGISYVFTITRVVQMLGEDEDWRMRYATKWIRKTAVSPSSAPVKRL